MTVPTQVMVGRAATAEALKLHDPRGAIVRSSANMAITRAYGALATTVCLFRGRFQRRRREAPRREAT